MFLFGSGGGSSSVVFSFALLGRSLSSRPLSLALSSFSSCRLVVPARRCFFYSTRLGSRFFSCSCCLFCSGSRFKLSRLTCVSSFPLLFASVLSFPRLTSLRARASFSVSSCRVSVSFVPSLPPAPPPSPFVPPTGPRRHLRPMTPYRKLP